MKRQTFFLLFLFILFSSFIFTYKCVIAEEPLKETTKSFIITDTKEKEANVSTSTLGIGTAKLDFFINDQYIVPWGYVRLGYNVKSLVPDISADLYIAVLFEDGTIVLIANGSLTSSIVPFASNIPLEDTEGLILEGSLPDNLAPYTFIFLGVLVKSGTDLLDVSNWISDVSSVTVATGNLSGDQREILAKFGNPQAVNIEFWHDSLMRIETWLYQAGNGMFEKTFHFINGSLHLDKLVESVEGGYSARSSSAPPVQFGPGDFGPATTTEMISEILGEPDRILLGAEPDTQTWIFNESNISVIIKNWVISQIEIY